MRVYYRNNDVDQRAERLPNVKDIVTQIRLIMQNKSLDEATRDKAFRFFYSVPPSQRDVTWANAALAFISTVKR
jgi:hypothetical protein